METFPVLVTVTEPYTGKKSVLSLEEALTPHYKSSHGEGSLEVALGRIAELEGTLGRLLEALVERRSLSLEAAAIISGSNYSSIVYNEGT
jgi:hypothetical protein